jgi:hypothetical protein
MYMSKIDVAGVHQIETGASPSRLTITLGFAILSLAIPILVAHLILEVAIKDFRRIARVAGIVAEEYMRAKGSTGC